MSASRRTATPARRGLLRPLNVDSGRPLRANSVEKLRLIGAVISYRHLEDLLAELLKKQGSAPEVLEYPY
jgi:hypothetical protein